MEIIHKQSTAYYLAIPMVDSTSPETFKTGLSPTDTAYYKDGAGAWTSLAITDTFSEIGSTGVYEIDIASGEISTHDQILIKVTASGAADTFVLFRLYANGLDDHSIFDHTSDNITGSVGSVTGAVGSVTAGVDLADNAITSAKYDESTAYPLASVDSGATQIARVGADGDTLETLSDQIDSCSTHAASDIWAVDATTQQTQGTFGQAIGDPGADSDTIWGLCNTNLDATISSRSDFDETTDQVIVTTNNDKTGYGLVGNAISASKFDQLTAFPLTATDSGATQIARVGADGDTLETLSDQIDGCSTFDHTTNPVELLDSGGTAGTSADELVDDIFDETFAELSQGAPTATPNLETAMMLLYMIARNRLDIDTTGGTDYKEVYNDSGTVICKKALTDDGSTYSEAEMETGP